MTFPTRSSAAPTAQPVPIEDAGGEELEVREGQMHVVTVARALAEILKIFGALGIVNVFSLSLLYQSSINLSGVLDGGKIRLAGVSDLSIRPLGEPYIDSIVCGIALIMIFIRFFYGSMILLEGDYVVNKNKPNYIRFWDFLPVIFFLPMFSFMSFYGGLGEIVPFTILLLSLLVIDVITMTMTIMKADATSKYTSERKRWATINAITLVVYLILYFIYTQTTLKSDIWSDTIFLYISIAIYCIASLIDLKINRSFYLGGGC